MAKKKLSKLKAVVSLTKREEKQVKEYCNIHKIFKDAKAKQRTLRKDMLILATRKLLMANRKTDGLLKSVILNGLLLFTSKNQYRNLGEFITLFNLEEKRSCFDTKLTVTLKPRKYWAEKLISNLRKKLGEELFNDVFEVHDEYVPNEEFHTRRWKDADFNKKVSPMFGDDGATNNDVFGSV